MSMLTARQDKPGAATVAGHCRHRITIGASPQTPKGQFIPIMGLTSEDGEAWLYINHLDTPIGPQPDIVAGKMNYAAAGNEHEMFMIGGDDDEALKWNMRWPDGASVPGRIRFKVSSHNVIFSKIKRPTAEELNQLAPGATFGGFAYPEADGAFVAYRADGKEGDIVYPDGSSVRRANGKLCTIRSMFFVDEAGARSPLIRMELTPGQDKAQWLELYIDDDERPEILQYLLDPARIGKITLDPILGYNVQGALIVSYSINATQGYGLNTAPESGNVNKFFCYAANIANTRMGVYRAINLPNHIINGQPRYARSVSGPTVLAPAISEFNVQDNDRQIVAGETYLIMNAKIDSNIQLYYDNVSGRGSFFGGADNMPDPAPNSNNVNTNLLVSAWLGYGAVVGVTRSGQAQPLGIKQSFMVAGSKQARNISAKGGFK